MKVRVLLDEKGSAVAIERAEQQAPSTAAGGWRASVAEPKGSKFHELELPNEFATIDSADDFHTRLMPYLAKLKH